MRADTQRNTGARARVVAVALCALVACHKKAPTPAAPQTLGEGRAVPSSAPPETNAAWTAYWHAGLAEISRYTLRQARYGEPRDGFAVVVFVTEDFLPEKQVKSERPREKTEIVPMLKMNLSKRFPTGIYSYSAMTSVFSPIHLGASPPSATKVTTSVAEWCGHVWTQLNRKNDGYRARTFSYFEAEGDLDTTISAPLLEDGIWTQLRMGPQHLPSGSIQIVPGTMTARLRHTPLEAEPANAKLAAGPGYEGKATLRYTLSYPRSRRSIAWDIDAAFPHELIAWTEVYPDGAKGEPLTTQARRTHVMRDAYWTHNKNQDRALRDLLGLPR